MKNLLLLSLLALTASGCSLFNDEPQQVEKSTDGEPVAAEEVTQEDIDEMQKEVDAAIEAGDTAACQAVADKNLAAQCETNIVFNMAKESGDAKECDKLDDDLAQACNSQLVD